MVLVHKASRYIHRHIHMYTCALTHTHVHMYTCTQTHVHMYTDTYVCTLSDCCWYTHPPGHLTQRGLLTVSLDPRGSCVFCTLCVFSAQCLVHALLHAYTSSLLHLPLHYNVMPSHAPFSSTFLLYPVHLSTSLIACTHLFPRGKFFSLCHCLQHSLPLA